MNLKKKLGGALLVTALGASLVGSGTFALFSSSATNANNNFTAGTLKIEDVTGGAALATSTFIGNLAPGDNGTGTLKIKNTGSLDAWVKINGTSNNADSIADNGVGDLFEGANPVTITYDQGAVLVPADQEISINVGYSFPLAAGNEYQGDTGNVTFNVIAVQARNNTNTAGDGPVNWN